MQTIETRKAKTKARKKCRVHGLEFIEDPSRGKGSHQAWIFHDPATKQEICVVLSGKKDLSPGTQRSVIDYVSQLAANKKALDIIRSLAVIVRIILEHSFNN